MNLLNYNLEDRHVSNCIVLKNRVSLLDLLPKKLDMLELGVAAGNFSEMILKHCNPNKLVLVDAFSDDRYEHCFNVCHNKFKKFINSGIISIHKCFSKDFLRIDGDCFDFIYIDTNHQYDNTYDELVLSSKKLNKNGLLCGHDYTVCNINKGLQYGVIKAVHKFLLNYDFRFKYITLEPNGYNSFALEKII